MTNNKNNKKNIFPILKMSSFHSFCIGQNSCLCKESDISYKKYSYQNRSKKEQKIDKATII